MPRKAPPTDTPQADGAASDAADLRALVSAPIALRHLRREGHAEFALEPDAGTRREIARELGLAKLRKLGFRGTIAPDGKDGWRLEAHLGATIVQPCVVTLEPVTTRIDEAILRRYRRNLPEPEPGSEAPIPEDDTLERLRADAIDPGEMMIEALALAIPAFPRAEGAELGESRFTEPGKTPMRDEDAKPFAALAALRSEADDGAEADAEPGKPGGPGKAAGKKAKGARKQ